MKIQNKVNFHNEFDFELRDAKTGEIKKRAKAYNIVLDQFFNDLLWYFTSATYSGGLFASAFMGGRIKLGDGTGTISADRTTLFNEIYDLSSPTSSFENNIAEDGLSGWFRLTGIMQTDEGNGNTYTEVGMASNSSGRLHTHALIEDENGNPTSITKTDQDVLTVYAKVYFEISADVPNPSNFGFVKGAGGSSYQPTLYNFLTYVFGYNTKLYHNATTRATYYFEVGDNSDPIDFEDRAVKNVIDYKSYFINNNPFERDFEAKKIIFPFTFYSTDGNGASGIREVGVWVSRMFIDIGSINTVSPSFFRAVLPVGNFTDYSVSDEYIGTGDGTEQIYTVKWKPIIAESETVYFDGVAKTRDVDYTINNTTGEITATVPNGEDITVDYDINFLPKDETKQLDISFELAFGTF